MLLPGLATTMGAMFGGGGSDLSKGIESMTEFARKLIEEGLEGDDSEEGRRHKHTRKEVDELMDLPIFQKFWEERDKRMGLTPQYD